MQDEGKSQDTTNNLIVELTSDRELTSAIDAQTTVPAAPGLYAIFVDVASSLPFPFNSYLRAKQARLIYVGKADNLLKRLVAQDLRHIGPSTFFRGIGAVLGFTPPRGSLIGKRNKNNYRFGHQDTKEIIEWIDAHLFVKWQTLAECDIRVWESRAIGTYRPLFNTQGNPDALQELAALRKKCRDVALADDPANP